MMRFKYAPWLAIGLAVQPGSLPLAEELPAPIKAIESRGAEIVGRFGAPDGLQGYAALYNGQAVALYLTRDGQHVLLGNLFDAQGENLSREPLEKLVYEPMAKEMWKRLGKTSWIADGKADAPRIVYLFSDPNCPYCNRFWQKTRPWVEAGKVQLRHIIVGMLQEDSLGKAAALLATAHPEAALAEHENAGKASTLAPLESIPPAIKKRLDDNLAMMDQLGAMATPAIFYLNEDGRLQQQQGEPNPNELAQIMGPP